MVLCSINPFGKMERRRMKETESKKETKEELIPITYDFMFKRVFGCEGNEDILKDLLESILNIQIQKISIKNPEMVKDKKMENPEHWI